MSVVHINCSFPADDALGANVPVEVRSADARLISRQPAWRAVDLDPGLYSATAQFPSGQILTGLIRVIAPDDHPDGFAREQASGISIVQEPEANVVLRMTAEAIATIIGRAGSGLESIHLLDRPVVLSDGVQTEAYRLDSLVVTVFRDVGLYRVPLFDPISQPMSARDLMQHGAAVQDSSNEHNVQFLPVPPSQDGNVDEAMLMYSYMRSPHAGSSAATKLFLDIQQPGAPRQFIALPATFSGPGQVVLLRSRHGWWVAHVHLTNPVANLLMHYLEVGRFRQATAALKVDNFGETVAADPIAATVIAYALLRFGEEEPLKFVTETLASQFGDLADTIALRGEYLARQGDHSGARAEFLSLGQKPLLLFSDGLNYAVNRLTRYAQYGLTSADSQSNPDAARAVEWTELLLSAGEMLQTLIQLRSIRSWVDPHRFTLSFAGDAPMLPSLVAEPQDHPGY